MTIEALHKTLRGCRSVYFDLANEREQNYPGGGFVSYPEPSAAPRPGGSTTGAPASPERFPAGTRRSFDPRPFRDNCLISLMPSSGSS